MQNIHKGLAAMLLAGGALASAVAFSGIAGAADQIDVDSTAPPGPLGAGPEHGGPGGPEGPHHLLKQLGLSAEQQSSIKAIMTAARPQMKSMHEQMRANHLKLMQTKPDDPNYGNVVAEVAQSNAALASQRTSHEAELRAQIHAVLTPAQRTQLATLEAEQQTHPEHGRFGPHPAD